MNRCFQCDMDPWVSCTVKHTPGGIAYISSIGCAKCDFAVRGYIDIKQSRAERSALRKWNLYQVNQKATRELEEKVNRETIKLTRRFWDCDCEKDYIRPSSQQWCSLCGSQREDCADSRLGEVIHWLMTEDV